MPTSSKKKPSKKPMSVKARIQALVARPISWVRKKSAEYLARRPHRSFRRTRRRDYARSLKLPGLLAFTHQVNRMLWAYRKTFALLVVFYAILTGILVGIASQETYTSLTSTLRDTTSAIFDGDLSQLGEAGLIFLSIASSGISDSPTEAQQIYGVLMALLAWLTTVWLLRNFLAGHKVKLRDGLYSAGAPLVPTFLVALVLIVQLVPVALAVLGYTAASASGLLAAGGVEAMLFWIAAGLLGLLSLYLVASTFFALIIVTLPGMYPLRALRAAGDIVIGRRIRILIRLLWMVLSVFVIWGLVLIPFILLDTWLKATWPAIQWLPIIPVVMLALGSYTIVWSSSYVYLLYRKVVDDEAKPA